MEKMLTFRSKKMVINVDNAKTENRAHSQLEPFLERVMLALGGLTSNAWFPPILYTVSNDVE